MTTMIVCDAYCFAEKLEQDYKQERSNSSSTTKFYRNVKETMFHSLELADGGIRKIGFPKGFICLHRP